MGTADTQIAKGREALLYFHNDSVIYDNYGLTFEALLDQVSKGKPTIFLEGFGLAIESINEDGYFGMDKVDAAMSALAKKAQGKVPANQQSFFAALSNQAQDFSFVDATGYVAKNTAIKVGEGLVEVGETVKSTLGGLGMVLPFLVVGGLVFYVYRKVKHA